MRKFVYQASICALAIATATPAFAEDKSAASSTTQSGQIADIVVTAQRVSQSVQKSSITISVFNGQQLANAGVFDSRDITKLDPSVQIGQGGPSPQIYIRGVGDFGSTPLTNPAVAVNIDGIYVSRSASVEGNFYDLQRVEVLKGPQGTLYGRNATGGAINIITNKPDLTGASGRIGLELGNYNAVLADGMVNLPVAANFALRAAGQLGRHDGYDSEGFDDSKFETGRLSAFWEPSNTVSLLVSGSYQHIGGKGPSYVYKGPLAAGITPAVNALGVVERPLDPRTSIADPAVAPLYNAVTAVAGLCAPNAFLDSATGNNGPIALAQVQGMCPPGLSTLAQFPNASAGFVDNKFWNVNAELKADLGFANLTVLPGYRGVSDSYITFPIITYDDSATRPETSTALSLETRLSHNGPAIRWVAGLFLYEEKQSYATGGPLNTWLLLQSSITDAHLETDSYAAFGQVNVNVTPDIRLIGGARLSRDHRTINGFIYQTPNAYAFGFTAGGPCFLAASPCVVDQFSNKKNFDSFTWKLGAEQDISPSNMLYATVSTGFKAGGFNHASGDTRGVASFYLPEKLTAYEVGSRNRFLGNRLQINAEAFYWKYKDAQQQFIALSSVNTLVLPYTNAGSAHSYGLTLDVSAKPSPHDTFQIGAEFLRSKFDNFVYSTVLQSPGVTTGCTVTSANPPPKQTVDCSGMPMIRSPDLAGTTSYAHVFELAQGGMIEAKVMGQFASKRWLNIDYTAAEHANGYFMADATLTYEAPNKAFSVTAFIRNLSNALAYTGAFTSFATPGLTEANLGAPRTFGGRFNVSF